MALAMELLGMLAALGGSSSLEVAMEEVMREMET